MNLFNSVIPLEIVFKETRYPNVCFEIIEMVAFYIVRADEPLALDRMTNDFTNNHSYN